MTDEFDGCLACDLITDITADAALPGDDDDDRVLLRITSSDLRSSSDAHSRLLYRHLPRLLRADFGSLGALGVLEELFEAKTAVLDELAETLVVIQGVLLHLATARSGETATKTEQLAVLIGHLCRHEVLAPDAPESSDRHLERAVTIAETLVKSLPEHEVSPGSLPS